MKVYLIGAGPGDAELITLKAVRYLKKADFIVYDHLVNKKILKHVNDSAEIFYAGKQGGKHTLNQNEINELLITKAKEGKIVARVKGGDPFLFGRGGEEALALKDAGIPYLIVPGVTSAIAVPTYSGIPITQRGYVSYLIIATGQEDPSKKETAIDWEMIAQSKGTTVFLMGAENLHAIARKLIECGSSPDTPIALIRHGTYSDQQTWIGTLKDIEQYSIKMEPPLIIVIGEVVTLREKLIWFDSLLLFNKKILITRHEDGIEEFEQKLSDLGADVSALPAIKIEPDYSGMDTLLERGFLKGYQWLIFTSANGVKYFFEYLYSKRLDSRILKDIQIGGIGIKTSQKLKEHGIIADLIPSKFTSEALGEELIKNNIAGQKFLLLRADLATDTLPDILKKNNAIVHKVDIYKITLPSFDKELTKDLKKEKFSCIAFTSPATVRNFVKILGDNISQDTCLASIGPVTSKEIKKIFNRVDIEAKEHTLNGLADAIINYF